MGRPSKYTKAICDRICEEIAGSSQSLKTICEADNMPGVTTVLRWLSEEDKQEFRDQYARAKEEQADFLAEEILEIADDARNDFMTKVVGDETYEVENKEFVNRSRLRIEARKWIASKLKPKKYGEKQEIELTTPPEGFTINVID